MHIFFVFECCRTTLCGSSIGAFCIVNRFDFAFCFFAKKSEKDCHLFSPTMATGPTPFNIGNNMGVFQQPVSGVLSTGGDPPGLRHGSGAASFARTIAAQYGGPMGLTPASSPGPAVGRRRNRERDRERSRDGRGMDDEPRAQSNPAGQAPAGIQTAIELKEVTDGLNDRLEDVSRRLIALEGLHLKQANSITENANTARNNLAAMMTAISEVKTATVSEISMLGARIDSLAESGAVLKDRLDNGSERIERKFNEIQAYLRSMQHSTPPTAAVDPLRTKAMGQPEQHPIGTEGTFHPQQSNRDQGAGSPWFGSPNSPPNRYPNGFDGPSGGGGGGGDGGDGNGNAASTRAAPGPVLGANSNYNSKIPRKNLPQKYESIVWIICQIHGL